MRKLVSLAMIGVLAMGVGVGLSGCSEESKTETRTTQSTPGGKTTEIERKEIKQSGDNPPAPTKTP